jgi:hypothetical protein
MLVGLLPLVADLTFEELSGFFELRPGNVGIATVQGCMGARTQAGHGAVLVVSRGDHGGFFLGGFRRAIRWGVT